MPGILVLQPCQGVQRGPISQGALVEWCPGCPEEVLSLGSLQHACQVYMEVYYQFHLYTLHGQRAV